jgi:hypothetical protein
LRRWFEKQDLFVELSYAPLLRRWLEKHDLFVKLPDAAFFR